MKHIKKVFLGLLLGFALFAGSASFAYWVSGVIGWKQTATPDVTVGVGKSVTISVDLSRTDGNTKVLVPAGRVVDSNAQTDSVTVTYTVKWNENSLLNGIVDANIAAAVTNITVGGVANPYSLITVTPSGNPTTIAHKETVTFTFIVTLTEPANKTQYDAVANKTIAFDIDFSITPN